MKINRIETRVMINILHYFFQPVNIINNFVAQGEQVLNTSIKLKYKTNNPLDMSLSYSPKMKYMKYLTLEVFVSQLQL